MVFNYFIMNDLLIKVAFAPLIVVYLYRLWFIKRNAENKNQFSDLNYLIFYFHSEKDSDNLRNIKRKINMLTTLNYVFLIIIAIMIIRQMLIVQM